MAELNYRVSKDELLQQIDLRTIDGVTPFYFRINPQYRRQIVQELGHYGEVDVDEFLQTEYLGLELRDRQKVNQFVERLYQQPIPGIMRVGVDVRGEFD